MEQENDNNDHKGSQSKLNIWSVLSVLFAIGAVICVILLIKTTIDQKRRAEEMSNLISTTVESNALSGESIEPESSTQVAESSSEPEESSSEETKEVPRDTYADSVQFLKDAGIPIPDLTVDIASLQESTNPDIYAWIYVPGTKVNYPILQHPTDDSYYLNYNIDGTKGYPGCIYTEKTYNSKDFTDSNTVLYGHNMKNGTMLGSIHKFEDQAFFDEYQYIYVYTPERLLCYHIFAAYEHSNEHLLYYNNFSDPEIFQYYFEALKDERSINKHFREDVELTGTEHLITLSTCINNKSDKRYLVQGVLVNEE